MAGITVAVDIMVAVDFAAEAEDTPVGAMADTDS